MNVEQIATSFPCEASELLGIVSRPEAPRPKGLLCIVAGGPQYRAGCGRQLYSLAQAVSEQGNAVMRFDYRGMGDSSGDFNGFQSIENDIRAAIVEFRKHVPELKEIVLWGGCDGASASMIHCASFPEITSMILGNPFVSSEETQAVVARQHYLKRLTEKSFWLKLFKGQFDLVDYFERGINRLGKKFFGKFSKSSGRSAADLPFQKKMLLGMQRFNGSVLFLMSGKSLVSREFDVQVEKSADWQKVVKREVNRRIDLPDADQTFSTVESRKIIIDAACEWLKSGS